MGIQFQHRPLEGFPLLNLYYGSCCEEGGCSAQHQLIVRPEFHHAEILCLQRSMTLRQCQEKSEY